MTDRLDRPGFLAGGGAMGALIRAFAWSTTPLGPPEAWPQSLKTAARLLLSSGHPMLVWWGPELTQIYNDAHSPSLAPDRHPSALGQGARACWPEMWDVIGPQIEQVMTGRGPTWHENQRVPILRNGRLEDAYWTYSFNPIDEPAAPHGVGGVLLVCHEITALMLAERRRVFRIALEDKMSRVSKPAEIMRLAAEGLGRELGVDQANYYTIEGAHFIVEREWRTERSAGLVGRHALAAFGSDATRHAGAGGLLRLDDTRADGTQTAFAEAGMAALISVPLVRAGRWEGGLHVHQSEPRVWTDAEVSLVHEVADRTWAEIERARAVEQLRELNETLELRVEERTRERDRLWHNSRDLLSVVDTAGTFRAANPAWRTILGFGPDEVIGRSYLDFIHQGDHASSRDALAQASSRDGPPTYENRYRHKGGGYRWISWNAAQEKGLIYASGRHITEEKEAAEALERSQARLRAVFETSYQLQGLLTLDGTLVDANATSLAMIGTSLSDVLGKAFWETPWFAATPGVAERVRAASSAAANGETARQEIAVNLPSGVRTLDLSLRPIRDRHGTVVAIVPEAADITERRQAEEALRQSQKMEAVGQLTGGLAHDFNNLLTGIGGSLELIRTRLAQGRTTDLDRYITAAQSASKRAAALTHRMLAFSRRQTLDPKPTDINRLIRGMEELVRRTVGPAVAVEVVGAAGLWTALVDHNQLESALLNLCINARDAMPEGGRLTIATANDRLDDRAARERDLPRGQYLSLCVTDTGTGMAPDVIERAFDPFFTTKPIGMGTGLGLSMIYGFARQSGGQVRITSELGRGSTVCIHLPRHRGEADQADRAVEPADAPRAGQGETVLVVDDEPTVRMLIADVLEELGYAAIAKADGAAGIEVLQSDARVDLLVTDVGLPGGMNGRQVADAGRAIRPGLKVLFITGYAENAMIGNGHLEPGMHVLTKPFAMTMLGSRIRELIAGP